MDYEHLPGDGPLDETDLSLRAYLTDLSDRQLAEYDPAWSDEQVIAWNGNFRSDGALMLVCCERDIDVANFRQALEEHLRYRRPATRIPVRLQSLLLVVTTWWLGLAASAASAGDQWPQFRGEQAAGVADGVNLPDTWTTTENVAWQAEIPGHGWSSPIVWGDRVFVTSFVSEEKVVTPKSGFYAPFEVKTPPGEHRWSVFCFDAKSGKLRWEQAAHTGAPQHSIHVKASYAAETPATDGERLYVYFGNIGLFCYDLEGKLLWSKKWGAFPTRFGWGTGASPVLHGNRIYLVNDNEKESFITALDKRTGAEIWRISRDEKSSWSTPFVWEHGQQTEVVTCATGKVRSYDLDGKLLWELGGMSSICVPTPITAGELLIIDSGYEFARPRPLLAVNPGASGDISLKSGESKNVFIAWYREPAGSYHPTPLFYGNQLYVLYSTGMLSCFDPNTGEEIFGKQRLGGSFTASPWAADGKIYCLNEDGDTFVVQAGREFKLLSTNSLAEMCMATPAMTEGGLFVRTLTRLYCLRRAEAQAR